MVCSTCRKGLVGNNWRCDCNKVWSNCPVHHPIGTHDPPVQVDARPKAKPRAMSAGAAAKRLSRIEPSFAVRPCIGPSLQRRFPQLRDLVSPTLRLPAHETPSASSSQPPPPPSSHPLDGPEHALPSEAETTNQEEASGDVKDLERDNAESAVPRAVPAALAASLPLAAPAGVVPPAAADALAPRKKRSRPFNIPRT